MEAKVEIISRFTPLSLSEKLSILDALSELVQQEMEQEVSSSDVYKAINHEDYFIDADAQRQEEVPILHPLTGSVNWQETCEMKSCPDCNHTNLMKWGKYRGQQRYKCNLCGHVHTSNSFTLSYGIKKIEEFESFGHRMFEGNYESLSVLSQDLQIDRNTAFDWRHKYLSALSASPSDNQYSGTVEMDDVWFGLDEKGREISDKDTVRPPIGAGDNDMQVKLLCCYERESKKFDAFVVRSGRLTQEDIERTVGNKFGQGSKIYSDKHQSIKAFTTKHNIEHHTFLAKKHVKDKVVHVQNINNYASEMKGIFLRKMKGVATKYLQNYANWVIINKMVKSTDTTSIEAINHYKGKQKSWDYYSNAEKIYKRFLELFSRLEYINPVKMELKSCLWNFQRICQLLI
jgi:transposase-like protein